MESLDLVEKGDPPYGHVNGLRDVDPGSIAEE